MHYWGDEWFKKHGDNLYSAINEIEDGLRKYHIGVCGKEKYGCYRDDFLRFWDGSLYYIIFGPKCYIGPSKTYKHKFFQNIVQKIHNIIYWFDHYIIPYRKTKYGWLKAGFADFNRLMGLVYLVRRYQAAKYNKVFQIICKKYPDVIDELICDATGYEMIKPCKWGDIDGNEIHKKYWKEVKTNTDEKNK